MLNQTGLDNCSDSATRLVGRPSHFSAEHIAKLLAEACRKAIPRRPAEATDLGEIPTQFTAKIEARERRENVAGFGVLNSLGQGESHDSQLKE